MESWLTSLGLSPEFAGQIVTGASFLVSGAAVTIVVTAIVIYRYLRRDFADRVVYGVNLIQDDRLMLRTVEALPISEILTENRLFRFRLLRAFGRCTPGKPFVDMAQRDLNVLQPAVLNGLARTFSDATLANFFGLPVTRRTALIATLYETDPRVQVRMMRVIITTDDQLAQVRALAQDPNIKDRLQLSADHHWTRFKTLQRIAERRANELDGKEKRRLIDVVEIMFPRGETGPLGGL